MSKVCVIALDGATFRVLSPLMKAGRLNTLQQLMTEGTAGSLESIFPPITAPAWASFMTGVGPGRHSIYEFLQRSNTSHERVPVNATMLGAPTLWSHLSGCGKKVGVVNVPLTYPHTPLNGISIGDFLTPAGSLDFAYPPEVVKDIEADLGPYPLYVRQVYYRGNVQNVLDELYAFQEYYEAVTLKLLQRDEWDFFMTHFAGTDRIQHELWQILDATHPMSRPDETAAFAEQVTDFYQRVDESVRRIIAALDEETTVIVMSDHGFGPISRFVNMNLWLMEQGYLILKRDILTQLKRALFKAGFTPGFFYRLAMRFGFANLRLSQGMSMRNRLLSMLDQVFLSLKDVDWSRTQAYSRGNYGQIFVNQIGREREGIIEQRDISDLLDAITADLLTLTDPLTAQPIIEEVMRGQELYRGPYVKDAPDLCFTMAEGYKALGTLDFASNTVVEPAFGNSGDHRMDGILIAKGPHIKRQQAIEGARIIDLFPTILYAMGVPIPAHLDGRILTELFDPAYVEANAPLYTDNVENFTPQPSTYTPEEEAEIRARLKDLGYWG